MKLEAIILWLLFAVYMGVVAVGNFSTADYSAGSVNLTLAALSLFMAGKRLAR